MIEEDKKIERKSVIQFGQVKAKLVESSSRINREIKFLRDAPKREYQKC